MIELSFLRFSLVNIWGWISDWIYEMGSNFKEIYVHFASHDVCKINLTQINFYFKKWVYLLV
jgi:hypothetical protein